MVGSDRIGTAGLRHLYPSVDNPAVRILSSELTGSVRRDCDDKAAHDRFLEAAQSELTGSVISTAGLRPFLKRRQ